MKTTNFLHTLLVDNPVANVAIVGNAYGIMPYVEPLAKQLAENGYKPYWFAFSGQEKREGLYSSVQGLNDIKEAYLGIKAQNELPIFFIAHCAGSLMTMEFMRRNPDLIVEKLIVYGLLYSANRRRAIAERKFKMRGVSYQVSEEEWQYNPSETIQKLSCDILFCHAKDKLNLVRATEEEMIHVAALRDNIQLKWFEEGYDENNENIAKFMKTYLTYFKA